MLLFRRILFWFFVVIYITVCPLLILYALGYIYSPISGYLVQTGILHLSSIPTGADVYLEKSHFSYRTPIVIKELLKGNYRITLKKRGYKAWTNLIKIEAGKAAVFKNILLIPDYWPQKDITTHSCDDLIDIENEESFLITTGPELGSFFIYNVSGKARPLLSFQSSFLSALPVRKIYYKAQSSALVICAGTSKDKKYLYFNLEDKEPEAFDITHLIPDEPFFITWPVQKEVNLFTRKKNCISFANIETEEEYPCYLQNTKGFGVYGKGFYILDQNGVLIRQTIDSQKQEKLFYKIQSLSYQSEFYNIEAVAHKIILLLGTDGDFMINLPPYYIAPKNVIGYKLGNKSNLLYWTKTSLAVVDFPVGHSQDISNNSFNVQTVYENGKNLKQAFWINGGSHILCNDASSIYLIELQPQGPAHIEPVVKIKSDTNVFYDTDENILYFLDEKSGVLKQLELVPKQPITITP